EGIIDAEEAEKIKEEAYSRLFSVHWQLRTLLYLGVILLSAGLGIYIYQHIDSVGHITIVVVIGLISAGSFYYSMHHMAAFSRERAESPGLWKDYILLLGCLTFLVFEGYLQWQFSIFGERYGLATIIPAAVLLFVAY